MLKGGRHGIMVHEVFECFLVIIDKSNNYTYYEEESYQQITRPVPLSSSFNVV